MLCHLIIENLILVQRSSIPFQSGLHVFSGETGAGKSAILAALQLLFGKKSQPTLVRTGEKSGFVEALFDVRQITPIQEILQQAGIAHDPEQHLIIKRMISSKGTSRSFVNNQFASKDLLQSLCSHLIEIVGQHATHTLFHTPYHRSCLDLFADTLSALQDFQEKYTLQKKLVQQLQEYQQQEAFRIRELAICEQQIQEITEANIEEGEEELVFQEYTTITNAAELFSGLKEIASLLKGQRGAMIPTLSAASQKMEQLVTLNSSLEETKTLLHSCLAELGELEYSLSDAASKLQFHPERKEILNERLCCIAKMKKKYGPEIQDVQNFLENTKKKQQDLLECDLLTENLQKKIVESTEQTDRAAKKLTEKRAIAANNFAKLMTEQLKELNMPNAQFCCQLFASQRTLEGDETVLFSLAPNKGERTMPLHKAASGGEIARVLLAIKMLLAQKDGIPTLIFDEIDANIGGKTATLVGKKLQELGKHHQIFCITHFPQVAQQADHQIVITKRCCDQRTVTEITPLPEKEREQELARMQGI